MNRLTTDFFRPYSPDQVSALMSLALEMEVYGLTAADVITLAKEYFSELSGRSRSHNAINNHIHVGKSADPRICPDCGYPVVIQPVNVSRCTNIGGAWRSSLVCSNATCRFTELSIKTLTEWRTM